MKNLTIVALIALITLQLRAQDISSMQKSNINKNHFYIELVSKAATIKGDWGLFGGIRAGYNFNEDVSLGLIAHGLIPDKIGGSYINRKGRNELHIGYGGAEAAYKYDLSDKFNLAGKIMIGAGRADYESVGGKDYFFITEPGVSFNYRLTDWFGIGYSLNYRFASGVNYSDINNASLSGWSADLDFKFGF